MKKKSFIAALLLAGATAMVMGIAGCSNNEAKAGKSAYEIYVDAYITANGSSDGVLSESDWLSSLKGQPGVKGETGDKGDQGENGASAYDIYKENTTDNPVLTEEEWLESLKGDKGDGYWESNPQGLAFYPLDDGSLAVGAGMAKLLSEITVPEQFNGKVITAVYDFSDCANLESVELPESVKEIYDGAFANCTKLSRVSVGGEVIEVFAFNRTYYSSAFSIGVDAFSHTCVPMQIEIEDSYDGDTEVMLTVSNKHQGVNKLELTAALNSVTDQRATLAIDLIESKATESFKVDFGTYGLFKDIDIDLYKGEQKHFSIENASGVAVTADEYNFAPLTASYPVLVFSLELNSITDNGNIPTFVCMDRYQQYNWDNLPYNMHIMPFVKSSDITSNYAFHPLRQPTANYIAELYELNPNSKFNLFIGDNYGELVLQMFVANHIPETNWTATLLSDGAGTAGILSNTFGVDNPQQKYDQMKDNWEKIKNYVYNAGEYDFRQISTMALGYAREYQILETYAYILAKEESNVKWVVNRLREGENLVAINNKSPEFVTELLTHVEQVYTNNLLSALNDEQAENFKKLYKFNDDMFTSAEEQGKEVIVILGTSWNGENGNLYDNVKMLVELYGTDDYVYYYKGHPGYPTAQYVGRQQYFADLAEEGYVINELDNAIAAEIILFFKPDIYMAGYSTSTFDSVEGQDKALLLFGSKAAFASKTYAKYFDVFASVITDVSAYQGVTINAEHKSYLMEYNNTAEYASQVENYNKHEIAIYDTVDKSIKYYKLNGETSVYEEVDVNGEAIAVS